MVETYIENRGDLFRHKQQKIRLKLHCYSPFGVRRGLKIILSHRAPSSLSMTPYRAIWTHFSPNSTIFMHPKSTKMAPQTAQHSTSAPKARPEAPGNPQEAPRRPPGEGGSTKVSKDIPRRPRGPGSLNYEPQRPRSPHIPRRLEQ